MQCKLTFATQIQLYAVHMDANGGTCSQTSRCANIQKFIPMMQAMTDAGFARGDVIVYILKKDPQTQKRSVQAILYGKDMDILEWFVLNGAGHIRSIELD